MRPATDVLAAVLADQRLVDEVHGMLWLPPRRNGGERDGGWSCRDHVVVIGELLSQMGVTNVEVRHGRAYFVNTLLCPTRGPIGLGQDGQADSGMHSWLHVEGFGDIDLSPKLDAADFPWFPIGSPGVIGSEVVTESMGTFPVRTCQTINEYSNEIARATHATGRIDALNWVFAKGPFSSQISERGLDWANSPLSVALRACGSAHGGGQDLYSRLGRHLLGVLVGTREPLLSGADASIHEQARAWDLIGADSSLARPGSCIAAEATS